MVQVNYNTLTSECFERYLEFLIGQLFKCIPIYENEPSTLLPYLESLKIELIGNKELIEQIRYDGQFLKLLGTIQFFISNEYNKKTLKKEIFKSINIIKSLQTKYFSKVGGVE